MFFLPLILWQKVPRCVGNYQTEAKVFCLNIKSPKIKNHPNTALFNGKEGKGSEREGGMVWKTQ